MKTSLILILLFAGVFFVSDSFSGEVHNTVEDNEYRKPLMECYKCKYGPEGWTDQIACIAHYMSSEHCKARNRTKLPCCTRDFDFDCINNHGVVRWTDLHPGPSISKQCFPSAPDVGKACASGNECLSGVCDLEGVLKTDKCKLIKKVLTGKRNRYTNEEEYIATYSCVTTKPGICTDAPPNQTNPGGVYHGFIMKKNIMIETYAEGPIY